MRSSKVAAGSFRTSWSASTISPRLWGAMFVAIPTAIPAEPLMSRLGTLPGRRSGSLSVPSKLSVQEMVSFSMSRSISSASGLRRASVYRIAAGESPSMEPKFPCPSMRG